MSLNVYPSEQKAIKRAIAEETKRLRDNQSKINALTDFRDRLVDRIYKIGFVAIVNVDVTDPSNYELANEHSNDLIFSPRIDIAARVLEQDIDFDRMQYEVQHGMDGKGSYKIMPDGTKKEV